MNKRRKNNLIYRLVRIAVPITSALPRFLGLPLFAMIGRIGYRLARIDRLRAINHLRLIYGGEWSEERIQATAKAVFRELGKNLFDALFLSARPQKSVERMTVCDDWGPVTQAYNQKKGLIAITAHCGCFELLLHRFAWQGLKCFAIGQRIYDQRLEKYVAQLRSGPNISYMHRDGSSREVLRHLRVGEVFGVLIDQDTKVEGEFAPFLGRPAHTPSGPMRIAMRYKIPVFVVTANRRPDNRHQVSIVGPVELADSGDFQKDLVANLASVNDIISAAIRRAPEQWVWMHRRWRQQPEKAEM
jgi:KDO2-lipid IV(A) lauroyltransferase